MAAAMVSGCVTSYSTICTRRSAPLGSRPYAIAVSRYACALSVLRTPTRTLQAHLSRFRGALTKHLSACCPSCMHACMHVSVHVRTQALGGLCSRSLEALQQQLPHDPGPQPPCAARHKHLQAMSYR